MQGPAVKFTRLWDDVIKKYAFYTQIDNDPAKRAYLLPYPDNTQTGHRKEIIRAVQTVDQTANGKYVFECTGCDYNGSGSSNGLFYAGVVGVILLALAASYFFGGA